MGPAGWNCHLTASIHRETAARDGSVVGVTVVRAFGSERAFRNEFPYLGRVGRAACTAHRLVDGYRSGRTPCFRRARPGADPRSGAGRAQKGRSSEGCPEGARRPGAGRSRPAGSGSPGAGPGSTGWRGSRTTAGPAGPADLCTLDQILPEGPGRQRQAGLFHRQGRPHRVPASPWSQPSSSSPRANRRRSFA